MRSAALHTLCFLGVFALVLGGLQGSFAGFSGQTENPGNSVTAANDFRAPTVERSVIARSASAPPGYVKQLGTYFVYANVTDTGNPASGVASVTADLSNVSTGITAATLTAGSYTVDGVSYNYRSASQVVTSLLSEGSKSYSVTATDADANAATRSDLSVTVDNTAPTGADVQTANGGATVGRPQTGDTITFTFSEPIDPQSVLSGWTGGSTSVVVRMTNVILGLANDTLQVYNAADSAALPLGTTDLGRGDYVTTFLNLGGEILKFGDTGTASTMVMSGNTITVTLGTAGGNANANTAANNGTMSWTPSLGATDRAGNAASTAAASESGGADKEF